MQKYAEQFYKSTAWQNIQRIAMQRDRFLCVECMKAGRITPAALVHHIKPITRQNINDPEITLNLDNLEAVCVQCHADLHPKTNGRRYSVDNEGNIAPRPQKTCG